MVDDSRIELFIFPDGTAIEMLVFESTSGGRARRTPAPAGGAADHAAA